MKKIIFQCNYKKIVLFINDDKLKIINYFNKLKDIKKRIKYNIISDERIIDNIVCNYSFITSVFKNPTFKLKKIKDNQFIIE